MYGSMRNNLIWKVGSIKEMENNTIFTLNTFKIVLEFWLMHRFKFRFRNSFLSSMSSTSWSSSCLLWSSQNKSKLSLETTKSDILSTISLLCQKDKLFSKALAMIEWLTITRYSSTLVPSTIVLIYRKNTIIKS